MDDKDKDALGGAAAGGVIGGIIGGPAGGAVGAALGSIIASHESTHEDIVRTAAYEILDEAPSNATLYVDHVQPDGAADGNPEGVVDSINGVPDLLLTGQRCAQLVVEAETLGGIADDEQHALDQLADFRVHGFKRILLAPDDQIAEIEEWVHEHRRRDDINGQLTITPPDEIATYV